MEKINRKGGAEKARLKRAALLSQVANDPKQLKLFNFSSSSLVNRTETVVSNFEKTAEIKVSKFVTSDII